jgi:hypothetical protein
MNTLSTVRMIVWSRKKACICQRFLAVVTSKTLWMPPDEHQQEKEKGIVREKEMIRKTKKFKQPSI